VIMAGMGLGLSVLYSRPYSAFHAVLHVFKKNGALSLQVQLLHPLLLSAHLFFPAAAFPFHRK
jgi:hypothetical protein